MFYQLKKRSRATLKCLAGRMWPAGWTLPRPAVVPINLIKFAQILNLWPNVQLFKSVIYNSSSLMKVMLKVAIAENWYKYNHKKSKSITVNKCASICDGPPRHKGPFKWKATFTCPGPALPVWYVTYSI